MNTREIYLALGSNLGDRRKNILDAVSLLEEGFGSPCLRLSSLIETEAEGFEGPSFLNAAALWESSLEPLRILALCKDVETRLGREQTGIRLDAEGRRIYSSRPIDVDILLIGDEKIHTPELCVPHPRMKYREFVMLPLKEIIGDLSKFALLETENKII